MKTVVTTHDQLNKAAVKEAFRPVYNRLTTTTHERRLCIPQLAWKSPSLLLWLLVYSWNHHLNRSDRLSDERSPATLNCSETENCEANREQQTKTTVASKQSQVFVAAPSLQLILPAKSQQAQRNAVNLSRKTRFSQETGCVTSNAADNSAIWEQCCTTRENSTGNYLWIGKLNHSMHMYLF